MTIKRIISQIFFIYSVLFIHQNLFGQQNSLAHSIGKKEGFSESPVYAILKDQKGFMWYGTSDGLWRYDGYQHKSFRHDSKNANSLSHNFVTCLTEDNEGILWAGTLERGLNRFDPATNSFYRFEHVDNDSTTLLGNYISEVAEDIKGNIWVAAGKLSLLNKVSKTFSHFDNPSIRGWKTTSVYASKSGLLWVGSTGDGFSSFDPSTKSFKNYGVTHPDEVINTRANVIRSINEDDHGNIWVGTYGGLIKLDVSTEKITHWVHDDVDPTSLAHNSIWEVAPTNEDKVWIATWGGGIGYLDSKTGLFENSTFKSGGLYAVGSNEFPSLYRESDNTMWFGSNGKGIFRFKSISGLSYLPKPQGLLNKYFRTTIKGTFYTYFISDVNGLLAHSDQTGVAFTLPPWRDKKPSGLSGNRISSICENKNGTIVVGTDFGITFYDPRTKRTKYLLNNSNDSTSLSHNSVLTTFIDSKDRLWVGTAFGLDLYLPSTNNFSNWHSPILSSNSVTAIGETEEGMWVGTGTGGVNLLNPEKREAKVFRHDEKIDSTVSGNSISVVFTDSKQNLWIGTRSGLSRYKPKTQSFDRYMNQHRITEISENKNGVLFIQSTIGLYQLMPSDSAIDKKFSWKRATLPFGSLKSTWSGEEKRMYLFGDTEIGFIEPDKPKAVTSPSPIVITQFNLDPNNKHSLDSVEAMINPAHRKQITLNYNQNLFSIEFAVLDFSNPLGHEYAYQLQGFDDDWTYSGTRRFVTYTNMSPGNYLFRAKGSNSEGVWNEVGTTLSITILPPPWKTWWAYSLYAITFIGLLFFGRKAIINRERLKAQVSIEQKEKQTLKELDQLKTKFFSNITHEFRTPLTLIQGPANELLEKAKDPESQKLLTLIKNNSARLLTLINQLLDLTRLDAKEVKITYEAARPDAFLRSIISQFTSLASSKGIQLEWRISEMNQLVLMDKEKVETILINLISNALKFTSSGGWVIVISTFDNDILDVEVRDNGRGIPDEKLSRIFDRFYQVEATDSSHAEGTGIGLALVKEYVELMKGVIQVESKTGVGTSIKISLTLANAPYELKEGAIATFGKEIITHETTSVSTDELPLLLIVEDNEDIRSFIKTCLGNQYRYSEARHGREGLEKACLEIPDLIISDLMMPEVDGLELCAGIKKDPRTNHIPFVMLTAKAAEENKIEGLQTGADDYLIKPFNKAELVLKVRNLILLREKLQMRIKNDLLSQATPVVAQSASEQFIVKLKTYIEANLKEDTLTVEIMAAELAMSREQCYRKLMALTGLSPSAFVRKLRLQKAAQLLAAKWGPVSQIAYEVGFENLSYFSKAFKEEFGKLPSQY